MSVDRNSQGDNNNSFIFDNGRFIKYRRVIPEILPPVNCSYNATLYAVSDKNANTKDKTEIIKKIKENTKKIMDTERILQSEIINDFRTSKLQQRKLTN
jgi:hypothetical protein